MVHQKINLDPVLLDDWHVVARSSELLDAPLSVELLGVTIVLWRSPSTLLAWPDQCPHRGVPLSKGWIEGDRLVCPYHGLAFDETGRCVHVPSAPSLPSSDRVQIEGYQVQEAYGYVWVSLGSPTRPIPQFLEWQTPDQFTFLCGPYPIHTSAPRVVENFTDVAHFAFVHEGLLGDRQFPEVSDYTVEHSADGLTASGVQFYQPNPEGTGEGKTVVYAYKIFRPLVAYFCKGGGELQFSIFLAVTPVSEVHSIAWMGVARNYAPDALDADLIAFQGHLIAQDIPMLESQRPQQLPLDLKADFHIPADRLSVAYRKWLKQLGVTYGTC